MTSLGRLLGALASLMPALFVTLTSGGFALAQTGPKAATSPPTADHAPVVLRVVMHSPLVSLDPVAHSAYITRDHGYLIYDTLFAQDAQGVIRPQMVDHWTVSENRLTWDFNLRAGLLFHDAQPVTSEDVIASIRRWASRDVMGQWLFRRVKAIEAIDQTSFRIRLTEPTGLMLDALGRASSLPLFVMPARLAKTPSQISIAEFVGSGPFMFKADEFEPSARSVYVKFAGYKPRVEPASGLAGGKVAKVDRIEWRVINDPQTAARALLAGEIDLIEQPSPSLISELGASPQVNLLRQNPLGNQYALRFNSQLKPFDDPRVRRAVLLALNQQAILKAVHGELGEYRPCKALFVCATPLASDLGFEGALEGRADDAKALLAEAGYDGTPIVLLHATDLKILAALAPEARAQLERAGFKVEIQSMTWQELVVRRNIRDPGDQGRWHAFFTSWSGADVGHPVGTAFLNADCQTSIMGWPCDPAFEKLREAFAAEPDLERRKAMIPKIQEHFAQSPTHVHLGQWFRPMAVRRAVLGLIEAPVPVFWNIEKREP